MAKPFLQAKKGSEGFSVSFLLGVVFFAVWFFPWMLVFVILPCNFPAFLACFLDSQCFAWILAGFFQFCKHPFLLSGLNRVSIGFLRVCYILIFFHFFVSFFLRHPCTFPLFSMDYLLTYPVFKVLMIFIAGFCFCFPSFLCEETPPSRPTTTTAFSFFSCTKITKCQGILPWTGHFQHPFIPSLPLLWFLGSMSLAEDCWPLTTTLKIAPWSLTPMRQPWKMFRPQEGIPIEKRYDSMMISCGDFMVT